MQQRQCLILQGDSLWLKKQALTLYNQAQQTQRLWLSDSAAHSATALPLKRAAQHLGDEYSLIIFDCSQPFSADALGAIIGTIRAGGALILLMPNARPDSLWLQRFICVAEDNAAICICQQPETVPTLVLPTFDNINSAVQPTEEQQQAITAVLKVVTGHRRRPLVISSDRGRGKTALLGMAAAELLQRGKTRVLITGPDKANSEVLLHHASLLLSGSKRTHKGLTWQQGEIVFIAPDALLQQRPQADLLMVDEAATIPVPLLEKMLQAYSRIVFATTLHGYEGTGRGFSLRFQKTLDSQTPNWRALTINKPIRWVDNDLLEHFSFEALLLNAEPVSADLISAANTNNVSFELLAPGQFLEDETLLKQVFGLMVLAHYRTRPSDLQMMLDRDDINVAVLRHQNNIVATAWLVEEPIIDKTLAAKVFDGERRLKGHLLPQSLLAHVGLPDAGDYHYQRIIRLAVHPAIQSRGLGSYLLQQLLKQAEGKTDLIGTSFALEQQVLDFWLNNGLKPVRLGQHRDEVTGSVSIMLLAGVSDSGQTFSGKAEQLLTQQWPLLLQRQLSLLPISQLVRLATVLSATEPDIGELERLQVQRFAYAQRALESSDIALWKWLTKEMGRQAFARLDTGQQSLLVMLIMQQRPISDVASELGFSGRHALIKALRQAVSDCLSVDAGSSVETK